MKYIKTQILCKSCGNIRKKIAEFYSANDKNIDRIVESVNKEQEDNNVPPFEGEEVKLEDVPEVDFGNTDALSGGK